MDILAVRRLRHVDDAIPHEGIDNLKRQRRLIELDRLSARA